MYTISKIQLIKRIENNREEIEYKNEIKENHQEINSIFKKIDLDQFCNLESSITTYELICNQPVEINLICKTNYQ